ncbi:DUF5994 family protein [Nonomuraea sp. H19]|uniref:DUF5994 family protein n=1 Tax=Nonomuraea sp. H19 TaxID=3452206 RepID=UPI003F892375
MTPKLLSHLKPLSVTARAIPTIDSVVRLSLNPVLDRRATVDGAWWPRSRDASAELPGLIAAVDQRLGRTTLRVGVYRDAWGHIPRRIPARGRQIRVSWFRSSDPRVITLMSAAGEPIVLLVIDPDTASGPAKAALTLTAQDTTGLHPAGILTIAHLPPSPARRPADADSSARWENEGGPSVDRGAARPTG